MSARDKLRACFPARSNDLIERVVDEILDEHAHELAERLRARSMEIAGYDDAYRHAADFIDPEVD